LLLPSVWNLVLFVSSSSVVGFTIKWIFYLRLAFWSLVIFLMVPTYYGIGVHDVMCDPSWWTLILLLIGNLARMGSDFLSPSILFSCSSFWGTLHTLQPASRTQANLASYESVFLINLAFIDVPSYLELLLVENPV
jgi:hypothetical protein